MYTLVIRPVRFYTTRSQPYAAADFDVTAVLEALRGGAGGEAEPEDAPGQPRDGDELLCYPAAQPNTFQVGPTRGQLRAAPCHTPTRGWG
jgi:hypothetical protein